MKYLLHSSLLIFLFLCSPVQIQAQLQNANKFASLTVSLQSNLPLPPDSLNYNYIVTLYRVDSPETLPVTLVLDTGRGLTLTQTCGGQFHSSPVKCDGVECLEFFKDQWKSPKLPTSGQVCKQSRSHMCNYTLARDQQVLNTGTLSKVNLIVNGTDMIPDFVFGCGQNTPAAPDLFGKSVDGVLGLGRDSNLSFLSQTNNIYQSFCFAYCLPSNSSSIGYLTFGKNNIHDNSKTLLFTPFSPNNKSHYVVDIVAITVGKTRLPIEYQSNIRGAVIESGEKFTRLPPKAYVMVRDEFKQQMGTKYTAAKAFSILDTCYDTTKHASITAPPMSFTFGNNMTVQLDVSGILYEVNSTLKCFAFAPTSYPGDLAIFASTQQRTLRMVFDVANWRLGIGNNGCP